MNKKLEPPAPSEGDLFQQAMEGVKPIAPSNRIPPSPPARRALTHKTVISPPSEKAFFSDHGASDIAPTSFLRTGLNSMTLRKLRRGQWPVQDSIDLHGSTTEEARQLLLEFLNHSLHRGLRCVNVIHGKGWRADGGEGILKIRVRHWLSQHQQVLAFCEAPAHAGGGGAVWLLLTSKDKTINAAQESSQ